MHRFYCPQLPATIEAAQPQVVLLDEDESHHCRKVLRLAVGDDVGVFDGQGGIGRGVIASTGRQVAVSVTSLVRHAEPTPAFDIAVALPKGPRADTLIEQASQLAARTLIPLRTQRSVTDPRETKLEKFQRACIESAKQCERPYLMRVTQTVDLAWLLAQPYDIKLIAHPRPDAKRPHIAVGKVSDIRTGLLLIGPEGGWTDDEVEQTVDAGGILWQFAPNILRVETAAAAGLAVLRYLS